MYRTWSTTALLLLTILVALVSEPRLPRAAVPAPMIVEWLNQTMTLRASAKALDQPVATGQSLGEIAAGAKIKAIGVVAGGEWVQIELPNKALAYVPKTALSLPAAGTASAPPSSSAAAASQQPAANVSAASSSAGGPAAVSGPVTKVPNAATLVVGDQRLRLVGIDPGPPAVLSPFEDWLLHKAGTLQCQPVAQTGRYLCRTADGSDVGGTAVLSGVARVGEGATADYRRFENSAREAKRGLWKEL